MHLNLHIYSPFHLLSLLYSKPYLKTYPHSVHSFQLFVAETIHLFPKSHFIVLVSDIPQFPVHFAFRKSHRGRRDVGRCGQCKAPPASLPHLGNRGRTCWCQSHLHPSCSLLLSHTSLLPVPGTCQSLSHIGHCAWWAQPYLWLFAWLVPSHLSGVQAETPLLRCFS